MSKVAVVIPNHTDELNELEKISLAQVRKVLGRYPLIHAVPEGKNFSYFAPGDMVVHFPAEYFQTLRGYNNLSISSLFYEPFLDFDYILIYQPDAFVFYDALEDFCSLGYDYIGAPWPRYAWAGSRDPKTPQVGNGGFCLRKIKACHKLLTRTESLPGWTNTREKYMEDAFFAVCGLTPEIDFNVAPVSVAKLFAMEWYPARHIKKIDGLPFGCHNWTKFSADFYTELFRQLGYDLQPFRGQMGNDDYEKQSPGMLTKLAMERLMRRIERGQSLLRYLPTKRFDSIRVIRSPEAVKILSRLLTEENSLTDKVFFYDTVEQINFRDANENLPHLLIAPSETREPHYGEHVISFRREYLKRCEELFHRLGR